MLIPKLPSTEAARCASPVRPVPRPASAPPIPSSVTEIRSISHPPVKNLLAGQLQSVRKRSFTDAREPLPSCGNRGIELLR
jgi:hypothetical protein